MVFPRKISDPEKELLFSILPSEKPGYNLYRGKFLDKYVIGCGRFGETNFIMGNKDEIISVYDASSTIFAEGSIVFDNGKIEITINEEIDGRLEFDISPKDYQQLFSGIKTKNWNYSKWLPGERSPKEGSAVREIAVIPGKYILAVSVGDRRIWIYEFGSGVNHLIPLSNFYNQLMILKNIRDPKIVLNPNLFFEKLSSYSDLELKNAFLIYNKYLKKLSIDKGQVMTKTINNKKKFFRFFNG